MKQIWFTSDIHFGHQNIIKYCDRPWDNVKDMNSGIVANWNAVVNPEDDVYILGDVCMGRLHETVKYVGMLNGRKHLVCGNHDVKARRMTEFTNNFVWVKDYHEANIPDGDGKQRICMSHYPMMIWHKNHKGSWMLCGHSHGSFPMTRPEYNGVGKVLDVGIDVHGYRPVSFHEVKEIMANKERFTPDHHGD